MSGFFGDDAECLQEALPFDVVLREGEALSPDGKLVAATDGEVLRTRDASSGKVLHELRISQLSGAEFSPDSKIIMTASARLRQLWAASSGAPLGEFEVEDTGADTLFSESGKLILIMGASGTRIFDVRSKKVVAALKDKGTSFAPGTFSPDDKLILAVWDRLEVREASTGRLVAELRGHEDRVTSMAFSPDSAYIVTTGAFFPTADIEEMTPASANAVRVWDARTGDAIYEFRDHSDGVQFGNFSRDGKYVLAADYDGTVHVYACDLCVPHDELLKLAQKRRVRELTPDEHARYQL